LSQKQPNPERSYYIIDTVSADCHGPVPERDMKILLCHGAIPPYYVISRRPIQPTRPWWKRRYALAPESRKSITGCSKPAHLLKGFYYNEAHDEYTKGMGLAAWMRGNAKGGDIFLGFEYERLSSKIWIILFWLAAAGVFILLWGNRILRGLQNLGAI